MTRLALAFALGAALPQYGVSMSGWALLLPAALLLPIGPFHRPARSPAGNPRRRRPPPPASVLLLLGAGLAAGWLHGSVAASRHAGDCRWRRPAGPLTLTVRVVRSDGPGRLRVRPVGGCRGEIRASLRPDVLPGLAPGHGARLRGRWRPEGRQRPGLDPVWAGTLLVDEGVDEGPAPGLRAALDRQRDAVARHLAGRFRREGGLVQALVVARRGELDEATRTAFVRAGTAHLLAISGFHVGLLAALAIWLVGRVATRRVATGVGAALAWGYVALLGLPDAATRAALLLSLAAAGRVVDRPILAAGALGTALLGLTVVDPGMAGRVGAQLSFAGALGLAVGAAPAAAFARGALTRLRGRAPSEAGGGLVDAAAAAVVATLATLPLVAWHFERVSLVSVPATLVATPLVALALPAVVATLVLDLLPLPGAGPAAAAVATGAEGLLGAARALVAAFAAPPWAALAVPRMSVGAALGGGAAALLLLRLERRVGPAVRSAVIASGVAAGLVAAPWVGGLGSAGGGGLRLHVLDAGQGDALALRTPAGRWVVIDAGPPRGERVARALARLGVRRIDLLVVTHPDADHAGGVEALLARFDVRRVAGPGTVRDEGPWRRALSVARARRIPWVVVARGDAWEVDGVAFRALHPAPAAGPVAGGDPNARSVVLHVAWREVDLLLTGDAPESAEAAFAEAAGQVEVLKVGHHGSRTSTGERFLERIRPRAALIPVGRGNRYGHPHPVVLDRLRRAGVQVWRTDRSGALTVYVDADGRWWVEAEDPDTGPDDGDSDGGRTNSRR